MPAAALVISPLVLSLKLHQRRQCSSTAQTYVRTRSFGFILQPRYAFGATPLDQ
jgi:hypothetical protein